MWLHRFLDPLPGRARAAWRDAGASAIAAGIAWVLAIWLLGHPHPIFAAISAIVCLSPGLPSHRQQAIGLMAGVATGIVFGELALLLPQGLPLPEGLSLLRLLVATFFSMLVATFYGLAPVVPIQAGVSAVLVLALGPETAGWLRMEDVVLGTAVGLLFSQVLLTPDPIRLIHDAIDALLLRLAECFRDAGDACNERDLEKAEFVLSQLTAAQESLIALNAGIDRARRVARWTLRGRFAARTITDTASQYDRRGIHLYAHSLLFAEALVDALRKDAPHADPKFIEAIESVSERCTCLVEDKPLTEAGAPIAPEELAPEWRDAATQLRAASTVLADFEKFRSSQSKLRRKISSGAKPSPEQAGP